MIPEIKHNVNGENYRENRLKEDGEVISNCIFHKVNSRIICYLSGYITFIFRNIFKNFIYLLFAVLGLCCCTWALPELEWRGGYSLVAVPTCVVASPVAKHRLINELRPSRVTLHTEPGPAPVFPADHDSKYISSPRV